MHSRFVIAHVQQLSALVEQYSALMNIRAINVLNPIFEKIKECGTCKGKKQTKSEEFVNEFQTALLSLTADDVDKIKKILGVDRFGFYTKAPSGKFVLHMLYDKSS